jgi:hypothetical protein
MTERSEVQVACQAGTAERGGGVTERSEVQVARGVRASGALVAWGPADEAVATRKGTPDG